MTKKQTILIFAILGIIILSSGSAVFAAGQGIYIPTNTGLANPPGGVRAIVGNFLTWLLGITGIIALIAFVISGIQYLTAAGNDSQMETAKNNLLYSIIGVVVASAGMVIIRVVDTFLRAN